jgi:hypothetical protein
MLEISGAESVIANVNFMSAPLSSWMKTTLVLAVLTLASVANAQGTFRNMDFESASLSGYLPGGMVPITSAMPGWSGSSGQVLYDSIAIGGGWISIFDSLNLGPAPFQGNYSAFLMGSPPGFPGGPASIDQTGLIPAGTRSIIVSMYWEIQAPVVTLGNQTITMIPVSTFPSYTVYAGDISSFAGQTAMLSFTAPAPSGSLTPSFLELDGISFSPIAVPEPSAAAMAALAGLALLNKSLMTNRRWLNPLGAKRKLSRLLTLHPYSRRQSHTSIVRLSNE